jgi:endonuclease/exonuclease/phosphatase family metal-dependent hydrolase
LRAALGNLVALAIGAYGVVLALYLALKIVVGGRWPVVAFLDSLVPLLLVPSLAFMPVCLMWRRRRAALALAPAVLTFVVAYGPLFVPRAPGAVPSGAQPFSLLSYNLHAESEQLAPMMTVIREADADIVALQELSPAAAGRFAAELADLYPYQAAHPGQANPIWGQGVLSKFPILDDEYWHIHLGHQRVTIDAPETRVVLYNTHPIHPFPIREGRLFDDGARGDEIAVLLRRASAESGAVILAGDFNMSDQTDDYGRIVARYHDAYREVGWGLGFTFPDFSQPEAVPAEAAGAVALPIRPVARLDYVFHTAHLRAVEAKVWHTSGGSDHRPVYVRLVVAR